MWTEKLTEKNINSLAQCQSKKEGNYISWTSDWLLQNVETYLANEKSFCDFKEQISVFVFSNMFYHEACYICDALGSRLPMPTSYEELFLLTNITSDKWPGSRDCVKDIFTPLNDINIEGTWTTHLSRESYKEKIPWSRGEPNGIIFENCAQFDSWGIYDTDCTTYKGCALCEFKDKVIYSLKGACELELRNIYFLAHQNKLNQLLFRGYGKYTIQRNGSIWQWKDISQNLLIAEMENSKYDYPMGRRNWTLYETVCDQSSGVKELLLSSCKENEFTCNDGKCINLTNRCDFKYDCIDYSDERNCHIISYPVDYKPDLPPRGNPDTNNILPISMKISVESVAVDTSLMEIRVSFFLKLLWYDNRLNFVNLKEVLNLNSVTQDNFRKLWIPFIGFMNSIGNSFTKFDDEASMYVLKSGSRYTIDRSKSVESKA